MDVAKYFLQQLGELDPAAEHRDRFPELEECPLDSTCGEDCRVAIDRAWGLRDLARKAGSSTIEEEIALRRIAYGIVCTYYFG